jgi:hypothetical protein
MSLLNSIFPVGHRRQWLKIDLGGCGLERAQKHQAGEDQSGKQDE